MRVPVRHFDRILRSGDRSYQLPCTKSEGVFSNLLQALWKDIEVASEANHTKILKEETIVDIPKYLIQYNLVSVLKRLKEHGKKLFLLTNR